MKLVKLMITLISCEDLRCPYTNKSIKKNAMATIRTPLPAGQVFTTTIDKNNGSYPHWNEKFLVEMSVNARWFDIEVRRGLDTLIGVARVPVSDFTNSLVPLGYLNFLSYRLRTRNGGFIRGIVNISVRIISPNASKDKIISLGRPVVSGIMGIKADREDGNCSESSGRQLSVFLEGGRLVTGIPVSYGIYENMCAQGVTI